MIDKNIKLKQKKKYSKNNGKMKKRVDIWQCL